MHDTFQNLCVCISLSGAEATGGAVPGGGRSTLRCPVRNFWRQVKLLGGEALREERTINEAKLKTEEGQESCVKHFTKIIS